MKKGDVAKEKVLKTAIKLFSRYGFEGTSFQLIAEKSKVSPTTPLYYFKTKESLVDAAIAQIISHNSSLLEEIMRPEDNALERIKKHFQMNLEWAKQFRDEAQVILLVYYLASFNKNWAKLYEKILQGARAKILEYLLAGKREGIFLFEMSPALLAEILHDALLGGIVNAVTIQQIDESSFRGLKTKWDTIIESLLLVKKN